MTKLIFSFSPQKEKGIRPTIAKVRQLGKKAQNYQLTVIEQMLKLATNAFGLVAALAWNNVIKELVDVYLKPLIGKESGLISLLIYAVIITVLAVTVTLQLSRLKEITKNKVSNE